jgi:hypothetical protein
MVASTLFSVFGLGALCWIVFNLAVYALPFSLGLAAGLYLYESGQGVLLPLTAGLFIGGFVAALSEIAFERIRFAPLKLAIGLVYAIPAGIAGFHAAKRFAELGASGDTTIAVLSWLGALVIGVTAWARVSGWSEVGEKPDHNVC